MFEPAFVAVCFFVFVAFMVQAATGFGAMLIALASSALFYPVDQLLVWFVPQVLLLSTYMLIRHHGHVDWSLFLKTILPVMGLGIVVGQLLFYQLETAWLKSLLGVVIVSLAVRELLRKADQTAKPPLVPWTAAAGVIHGIFATGGPLLVYALNAQGLSKSVFRSTLMTIWLVFAVVLLGSYAWAGKLNVQALPHIGVLAMVMPFSILVGERLHSRIDPQRFNRVINVLLVISGVVLIIG